MVFTSHKHHTYASQTPYLRGVNSILFCRYLRSLLLVAVMTLGGAVGAWGQTDYSGTYFIANGNGYSSTNAANNFYLVPATNSNYSTDQPHLTTSKTDQVLNCCWQIEKSGDYYRIIHVADGKYLTANPAMDGTSGNDVGRLRVHLEEIADITSDTDGNTLFEIKVNSKGGYNIRHKDMSDKVNNSTATYLDPAGGNVNGTNLTSGRTASTSNGKVNVGGGIGYWTDEAAARWQFEAVPQNNTYTYNIVDRQGNIAIKYTTGADQPAASPLSSYTDIPAAIRSPYLNGETVKFYTFSGAFDADNLTDENKIAATPVTDNANIYVIYTTDHLSEKFLRLQGKRAFNIDDGGCIFDNVGSLGTGGGSPTVTTTTHLWYISGNDPYAVQIKNLSTGKFLVSSALPTLSLAATATNNFILMEESAAANADHESMSLMVATGNTYTNDPTKAVNAYPVSSNVTYHLIDKAGKLIVSVPSTSSELALPDEWVSPLVSEYQYYSTSGYDSDTETYTPTGTVTSPFDVGSGGNIYVKYEANNSITFDTSDDNATGTTTYMLRYLGGQNFYQENGTDGVMDTDWKAIYPYSNGDAMLYVYGKERWDIQYAAGASTRPRWMWYVNSANSDPYNVKIKSHSGQSSSHNYFRTYEVSYGGNTHIVTGVTTLKAEAVKENELPTEYMVLTGPTGQCKLVTRDAINGERRTVNSFEQYWKNTPTVQNLLGTSKITATETGSDNIILSSAQENLLPTEWHTYKAFANAAPWVEWTDNDDKPTAKRYLSKNHWFQTIDMGESGEFVFEHVDLAPQVILLDQHGWEIMRAPLYTDDDYTVVNTAGLNKFNSPMVENYHWYPTASKVPGYHKYTVTDEDANIPVYTYSANPENNNKVEWHKLKDGDDVVTVTYSSNSLSDHPYAHFTTSGDFREGVSYEEQPKSVKTDFYVTYTVKSQYANAYHGAATEDAVTATPYLLKQNNTYATYGGSGTTIATVATKPSRENLTNDMEWYLKPNFNIDREMGYKYAGETGAQDGALDQPATELANYNEGRNGFDPYNVQIQSKAYPLRYFTANTTGSALSAGLWTGTSATVALQNMSTKQTAAGYDQTTLNITNATFMVVDDGAGNMRLMPRFDHSKVMQSFGTIAAQAAAASPDDEGTGSQTLFLESVAEAKEIHSSDEITDPNGYYLLAEDFSIASGFTSLENFTGIIDGQLHTISGLSVPLVKNANGAIIKNVILKEVKISQSGYVGAVACTATGATRIYNCGILPTEADNASGRSTVASTDDHCGSLVGYLDGSARVINCFSYANVSAGTGSGKNAGGIVGYNTTLSNQQEANLKTMVVNCMFYGDITAGTIKRPVYGGTRIKNTNVSSNIDYGLNNYNYYCEEEVTFDAAYTALTDYNCSWPVAKKYLTRFEVYRNILNSNRRLCTWWVNGSYGTPPSDTDVENVGIAKWVLDQSIAPYPILKEWGKYPSVINPDPDQRVDPSTKTWEPRASATSNWGKHSAPDTNGQILGSITVNINGGDHHTGSGSKTINITAMDTVYNDYCYGKIQLPYYNEIFGNPNGTTWNKKYGDNYTDYVVTGWEITSTDGSDADGHTFTADWQDGYNFADRQCTSKDLYGTSGRVFAQGGYYYVPDGVTTITITAHWGKAVYLYNDGRYLDRVGNAGANFVSAGALPTDIGNGKTMQTSLSGAVGALTVQPDKTVYDQAIVLVGNYQQNNFHSNIGLKGSEYDSEAKPFTIMSADFDFDNEPDFCFQAGMSGGGRQNVQPIRFDFLMVPDLTMAVRTDANYYGMRIFCPQGHFEVTETSYIYTTQFEYDKRDNSNYNKHEAPMILNGGEFMQIVSTEGTLTTVIDRTSYFLMGGNLYMKAFTPGTHGNRQAKTRHCAVNAIGGEYPEFYLSGMFRSDFYNATDNPHAYLDGGWFGLIAGAGMESVGAQNETNGGDVTFRINHSLISEFYGGGINANKPVTGTISVTIDNSKVTKYCGGPKLGDMKSTKSITTNATGTTFDEFYGGGNGGTNNERVRIYDSNGGVGAPTQANASTSWNGGTGGFDSFNPFRYVSGGYETEFEFEMLPFPSGSSNVVKRTYHYIATFSHTKVAPVTNYITDCTFNRNFYGGGNLGAVDGDVTSILQGNTIVHGSAFGAGFSASIPSFQVHDKSTVQYPYRDFAGFIHDGSLKFNPIHYTWIHDIPAEWSILPAPSTSNPTFQHDGKWYVYCPVELTGLGTVTGNVSLTIKGTTTVEGKVFNEDGTVKTGEIGGVYGGGDESAVDGNITVTLSENAEVLGNVFGGGNQGNVSGSTTVNIQE